MRHARARAPGRPAGGAAQKYSKQLRSPIQKSCLVTEAEMKIGKEIAREARMIGTIIIQIFDLFLRCALIRILTQSRWQRRGSGQRD